MAFELVPHHHSQPVTRTISTTLGADNILDKVAARAPKNDSQDITQSLSPTASQDQDARQEAVLKEMPTLENVMDNRIAAPTDSDAYDLHKEDIHQFQCGPFAFNLLFRALIG